MKIATVLQIMNYAAAYRGNFMDSLKSLDDKLRSIGGKNIYLFCAEARQGDARKWIDEMSADGDTVEFLEGDIAKDIQLIKRIVNQHNVKAIHTHFVTRQQYLAVYGASFGLRIPVIVHLHNHSLEQKNPIKKIMRELLYNNCYIVACSESVFESAIRDFPRNQKCYINNGVNFDRLDNFEIINDEEYGVRPGEKPVLIFGFDFYRKGVDLAVQAIKKLRDDGYSFTLLISLSKNFKEVRENIYSILGEVPEWIKIIKARNDVATLYNYVDLFLSPSREEGLPYSVVEAAYSRCSVVLSDISAQAKLRLKYGYWFNNEDADDLAQTILKAEQEHTDKLEHMDEVKTFMRKQYALDTWSDQVVDLYRRVMESD